MTIDVATGVKLSKLSEDPTNVRNLDTKEAREAISSLAASIRGIGLLQPLLVTGDNQIIDGHRRYRALKILEAAGEWNTEVPTMLYTGDLREMKIAQLVSNLQREDLDVFEEARMLFAIVELGESQKELAARVGLSQATVSKRLSLLSLPASAQKLIANGDLTIDEGARLAKVADHPKELAEFLKHDYFNASSVDRFVTNLLAREAANKLIEILVMRGWQLIDQPAMTHRLVKSYPAKVAKDQLLSPKEGQVAKVVVAGGEIHVSVFRTVERDEPEKKTSPAQAKAEASLKAERKAARETARQDKLILKAEVLSAGAKEVSELLVAETLHRTGFDVARRAGQLLDIEPQLRKSTYIGGKDEKDYFTPLMQYADQSPAKKRQVLLAVLLMDEMHTRGPAGAYRTQVLAEADRSQL